MEAFKKEWTIWKFSSPSTGETKIVARPSEPREIEHEYQQILGRTSAYTEKEALRIISTKDDSKNKEEFICGRYLGKELHYVCACPGEEGVDWGYDKLEKSKPLSLYWMRRFKKDMEFCKVKPFITTQ